MNPTASPDTSEFNAAVDFATSHEEWPGQPDAWAIGAATIMNGTILDVRFTHINVGENDRMAAFVWGGRLYNDLHRLAEHSGHWGLLSPFRSDSQPHANIEALDLAFKLNAHGPDEYDRRRVPVLAWVQSFDNPPADTLDAWLRLTLLSRREKQPNSMNLDGIFGVLPNVVWTSDGPFLPEGFEEARWSDLIMNNPPPTVYGIDKFPRMADYVVPSGVRIADADRVRLGAHLAPGTTVMHEGFVNYNGGTLGTSMVEGRISQGVAVGNGSDIGGGASIMGTLSGGGTEKIRIGERCLLGANAGIGISLGDNCVVEAGLYVTAGTKVIVRQADDDRVVPARELSGVNNVLFRRNSQSGEVEALPRTGQGIQLNAALHTND